MDSAELLYEGVAGFLATLYGLATDPVVALIIVAGVVTVYAIEAYAERGSSQ